MQKYQSVTGEFDGICRAVASLEADLGTHDLIQPGTGWNLDEKKSTWYQWDIRKECYKYNNGEGLSTLVKGSLCL